MKAGSNGYQLSISDHTIGLWLTQRLPLQPTGVLLEAKQKLRTALRSLRKTTSGILSARYFSLDEAFCDVENVLIYNVGPSVLSHLTGQGIVFCRVRSVPPTSPSGQPFPHYQEYTLVSAPSPPCVESVSTFSFSLNQISSTTKPHEIWWQASNVKASQQKTVSDRFSLYVELGTPTPIANVAAILKPLLDGIVSAMHLDTNPQIQVIKRLSERCGWDAFDIQRRLQAPPNPILGARTIVAPYRQFIKWNPADHLCEHCTLAVVSAEKLTCTVSIAAIH